MVLTLYLGAVLSDVAFLSTDYSFENGVPIPNGCTYYRCLLPSQVLNETGWDAHCGLPIGTEENGFGLTVEDGGLFGWSVVVMKLMMHHATARIMQRTQDLGARMLVDIDDFHYGLPPGNVAHRITDPTRNQNNNRMFYEIGIRQADAVSVSTEFLANFYERRCREVYLIRNALDVERYVMVDQPEVPTFGWVGATPWRTGGDLELLAEWMPRFVETFKVSVHHSGHIPCDPKHFAARTGLRRVSTSSMTNMEKYPSLLQQFHVGLVPLDMTDFSESKSFIKGLEYAAAGIPFIASPTREYRLLHASGVGRLASNAAEWMDHAIELLDPDIRREEAIRQRDIVEREFNIKGKAEQWATAIRG